MYTLEQLQSKALTELKEIGYELNVLPEGDRRRRQSWIDALVNVNPPLLQLLEVSPAAPVEQVQEPIIETVDASPGVEADQRQEPPIESKFGRIVYPRPAQGVIEQVAKTCPGVEVEQAQNAIKKVAKTSPAASVEQVQEAIELAVKTSPADPKFQVGDLVQSKTMLWGIQKKLMTGNVLELLPRGGVRVQFGDHISGYGGTFDFSKSQLEDLIPVQEPIKLVDDFVNTSQRQEPISQVAKTSPGVEVEQALGAISQVAKNLPGSRSKTSTAHQLLELFKSSAHIIEDAPGVKTEETVSESAIVPAVEKLPRSEPDPNPILTGIPLSDRFVARYSPPQPENIHFKADTDGQLNLLDF